MNEFEQDYSDYFDEDEKEYDLARQAILIYLNAQAEYQKIELSEEDKKQNSLQAFKDSVGLIKENDYRTIGVAGGPKLRYDDTVGDKNKKVFYIHANETDDNRFKKWQTFVGKKFEEAGLKFYYFK